MTTIRLLFQIDEVARKRGRDYRNIRVIIHANPEGRRLPRFKIEERWFVYDRQVRIA